MIKFVFGLIERYQKPVPSGEQIDHYKSASDSMVLGTLLRSCADAGIWPAPQPPYAGIMPDVLYTTITECNVRKLSSTYSRHNAVQIVRADEIMQEIETNMTLIKSAWNGLKLEDFS
jgi:hypothetical protein